jgi:hypothetical protein
MILDLTDEETDALARLLSRTIDDDRYPLSPRIQSLKGHISEAPTGAGPRALAPTEGLCATAS